MWERKWEARCLGLAGHGVRRARGDVRKGERAAGIPVGRRQGRGVGQACAGARGDFARIAGVGRGELEANEGHVAHSWTSRGSKKRAIQAAGAGTMKNVIKI